MKKAMVLFTAGVLVFSAANYASAEEQNTFRQMKQEHKQEFNNKRQELKDMLNLSDEQMEQAKKIRMEARPTIQPLVEDIHKKTQEMMDLKQSGATPEEMQAKKEELKQLREKANGIRKENMGKFESILNDDQKAKFESFKQERKDQRQQFRDDGKQKWGEAKNQRQQFRDDAKQKWGEMKEQRKEQRKNFHEEGNYNHQNR